MIVGYARVSTDGQTLDAQQSALTQAGAEKVFAEKVSGAVTDRKQLARAIATPGLRCSGATTFSDTNTIGDEDELLATGRNLDPAKEFVDGLGAVISHRAALPSAIRARAASHSSRDQRLHPGLSLIGGGIRPAAMCL
jgi:Resolvase, N terminal domain